MRTIRCSGHQGGVYPSMHWVGGCLPREVRVSALGGWIFAQREDGCLPGVSATPLLEQNYRPVLKHNLAATTLQTIIISQILGNRYVTYYPPSFWSRSPFRFSIVWWLNKKVVASTRNNSKSLAKLPIQTINCFPHRSFMRTKLRKSCQVAFFQFTVTIVQLGPKNHKIQLRNWYIFISAYYLDFNQSRESFWNMSYSGLDLKFCANLKYMELHNPVFNRPTPFLSQYYVTLKYNFKNNRNIFQWRYFWFKCMSSQIWRWDYQNWNEYI